MIGRSILKRFGRNEPPRRIGVFVSHSKDEAIAKQICTGIDDAGAESFLDELKVEAGDVFEQRLLDGLRRCEEHVILLSPRSVTRPYVWMELGASWIMGRRIVGIMNGITIRELRAMDGMPALIADLNLIDIGDVKSFFEELRRRAGHDAKQ